MLGSPLIPMPSRKPLSKKEVNELRKKLEEERDELSRQLSEFDESTFAGSQSEVSGEMSFDEEYADAGSDTFERERDLSLSNNIKDLLDKIEHALKRMDDGSYGLCERCGKPIEKARIKALPYASLCIEDAQAEGRR